MKDNPNHSQTEAGSSWWLLLSIGLMVLSLHFLRNSVHIEDKFFWLDECSTYFTASKPFLEIPSILKNGHNQPPLFYWVAHGVLKFGESFTLLRGISFFFVAGMFVFVIFGFGELRISSRFILCLLLMMSPHALYLSREFRPYAMAAFFILVSSVMLYRALTRPKKTAWAVWYGISALGLQYSLTLNCWVFASQMLVAGSVILVECKRRGISEAWNTFRPLIITCLILCLEYLAFLIWLLSKNPYLPEKSELLAEWNYWDCLLKNLNKSLFRGIMFKPNLWGWVSIGLFGLGAVVSVIKRQFLILAYLFLVFVGQLFFSTYMTYSRVPWFSPRYLTSCYVVYAIWGAVGYEFLVPRDWHLKKSLLFPLVFLILVLPRTIQGFRIAQKAPPYKSSWVKVIDSQQCRDCLTAVICSPDYICAIPGFIYRHSEIVRVFKNLSKNELQDLINFKWSVLFFDRSPSGSGITTLKTFKTLLNADEYHHTEIDFKHTDPRLVKEGHFPSFLYAFHHETNIKDGLTRMACANCATNQSIQEVIDKSNRADKIRVGTGVYTENVDFKNKAITIESSEEKGDRVIKGRVDLSGEWIIRKNAWIISGKPE